MAARAPKDDIVCGQNPKIFELIFFHDWHSSASIFDFEFHFCSGFILVHIFLSIPFCAFFSSKLRHFVFRWNLATHFLIFLKIESHQFHDQWIKSAQNIPYFLPGYWIQGRVFSHSSTAAPTCNNISIQKTLLFFAMFSMKSERLLNVRNFWLDLFFLRSVWSLIFSLLEVQIDTFYVQFVQIHFWSTSPFFSSSSEFLIHFGYTKLVQL